MNTGELPMVRSTVAFNYTLRPRLDVDASIGVVALASDATLEREWRRLLDTPGVGFYVGRVASPVEVTPDSLRGMQPLLVRALEHLVPDSPLDCIVYGCTSASMFIGEAEVGRLIAEVRPGVPATNPLSAAKAALASLGSRRMALLTPYIDDITVPMAEALEDSGIEVSAVGSFFNRLDAEVMRIDEDSIRRAALALVEDSGVDTLFIACTALGAAGLVAELERETGLSVITSNQAMAWHALRLAGDARLLDDRGRLFRLGAVKSR